MAWTPIPWFFMACAAYYGLGPLIYHYGNEESLKFCDIYYPVTELNLLRTNILDAVGIGLVIITFLICSQVIGLQRSRPSRPLNKESIRSATIFFLVVGGAIKYLLYLPYTFGHLNFTLPSSIGNLHIMTTLAILPLMVLVNIYGERWRILLYILIISELLVAILTFAKLAFLLTCLLTCLSLFFCSKRIKVFIVSCFILFLAYIIITPLMPYGREEMKKISGSNIQVGWAHRFNIVKAYLVTGSRNYYSRKKGLQMWWVRLNYANVQSFALDQYDAGQPGRSFLLALYTPIPRFLWPQKPSITGIGGEFNRSLVGSSASSSAPGVFAEAYWNEGNIMLILTSLYIGALLFGFTRYSLDKMSKSDFLLLPVIFIGLRMGCRPDGWFADEFFGALMIAIFTHYLLGAFARRFLRS